MKSGYSQGRKNLHIAVSLTLKQENSLIPKKETTYCGELKGMMVVAFYFSTLK
jgi:hypothetical protein